MTDCASYLRQQQLALAFRDGRNIGFCVGIRLHMPTRGQGRDDREDSKGCKIELSGTPAPHEPTLLLDPGGQHSTLHASAYHHKGQNA